MSLIDTVLGKGYAVKRRPYELNLIGVRSIPGAADSFDDNLACVWMDERGSENTRIYRCTTDPGRYWLDHPGRVEGTAILVPGQYPDSLTLGRHRGEYECLVQSGPGVFACWRRTDQHLVYGGNIYRDVQALQIHRAGDDSQAVSSWSAGCQVLQRTSDFLELMNLVHLHLAHGNDKLLSYSLLTTEDFPT